MILLIKRVIENKWYRESILFVFLCLITIINDSTGFVDIAEMTNGLFVFVALYVHLQLQRFLILPFLSRRQYVAYGILAFATIVMFSFFAYNLDSWLSKVGWYDEFEGKHWQLLLYYFLCCLLCVPLIMFVFYLVGYYRKEREDKEKQILLKEMELELLKTQLNPHFLFNSMNNLYGISLEKPDQVSNRILELSTIMRYQLELSRLKDVTLGQDLAFIENFISLETERLHNQCTVSFNCTVSDANREYYRIAPMILIAFIENCFKHIAPPKEGVAPAIDIAITLENDQVRLYAANTYCPQRVTFKSTKTGLINVHKRLRLLYPENHEVKFEKGDYAYKLWLYIKLQ